jgi:hypothetical protein
MTEWSHFDNLPTRWRSYVVDLNKMLTGHADFFDADAFTADTAVDKILTYLNTLNGRTGTLKPSSKKSWFSAVSTYLGALGKDRSAYRTIISSISKEIKNVPKTSHLPSAKNVEDLNNNLSYVIVNPKTNYHVRLLCCLIYYGYYYKIRPIDLCKTRHDIDNNIDNFLDMSAGTLKIHRTNHLPKFVPIHMKFLELIDKNKGSIWITGCELANTNSASVMFYNIFNKQSYRTVAKILYPIKNDDDSDESTQSNYEVSPPPSPAQPDVDIQSIVSKKIKVSVKKYDTKLSLTADQLTPSVDWNDLSNINIRVSTLSLYSWYLKKMQQNILDRVDKFYPNFFATESAFAAVVAFLDNYRKKNGSPYALHTKAIFITAICKYTQLSGLSSVVHQKYTNYLGTLERQIIEFIRNRTIPPFEPHIKDIRYLYHKSDIKNLRVILWIILNSIDLDSDTNIGILRFSDLINTKLSEDPVFSYIDLQKKIWLIREDQTKNATERTIHVSDKFISGLHNIYGAERTQWLLSNNKCEKYTHTNYFSCQFHDKVGMTYTEMRSSFITYMNEVLDDVGKCEILANNMGHSFNTREVNYVRDICDPEDNIDVNESDVF